MSTFECPAFDRLLEDQKELPRAFVRIIGPPGSGATILMKELVRKVRTAYPYVDSLENPSLMDEYFDEHLRNFKAVLKDYETDNEPCMVFIQELPSEHYLSVMRPLLEFYATHPKPVFVIVHSQVTPERMLERDAMTLVCTMDREPTGARSSCQEWPRRFAAFGQDCFDTVEDMKNTMEPDILHGKNRTTDNVLWEIVPPNHDVGSTLHMRDKQVLRISGPYKPQPKITIKDFTDYSSMIVALKDIVRSLQREKFSIPTTVQATSGAEQEESKD